VRKRKQEEEIEERRLKKEREELEEQFKREEAGKRKLQDDVKKANEDILENKRGVKNSPKKTRPNEMFG
jgi:hypothetical protein